MMYWSDGTSWWGWLLMSLGMVVFWGGLIGLVWYLVTHASTGGDQSVPSPSSPEQILDERFARGEIDADEYRTRRDALRNADRDPAHAGERR
jgi:putative membrane protein